MRDRPYSTLSAESRLAEQERRYREQMGAEKAERQKALAEAERKRKPKPTEADRESRYEWNDDDDETERSEAHRWGLGGADSEGAEA